MTSSDTPDAVDGEHYAEIDVTDWPVASREPLGTKPKRWLTDPQGERWLMKYTTYSQRHDGTRHRKGDDRSERIANGVAERLGVPAARTELAAEGRGVTPDTDPFEVLIRSEGWRATDRIEVFAYPERTPEGDLNTRFFARGVRHVEGAASAVGDLQVGDQLELVDEPDNPVNRRAVLLHTRTGRSVGYVPDCLVETIHELRDLDAPVEVTAEHVNPDTSPPHMRLLCRLRAPWPDGYEPLSGPEYQPIAA